MLADRIKQKIINQMIGFWSGPWPAPVNFVVWSTETPGTDEGPLLRGNIHDYRLEHGCYAR